MTYSSDGASGDPTERETGHSRLACFREEVRTWLQANVSPGWQEGIGSHDAFVGAQKDWFSKLCAAGYATPHWPADWPGGGRSLSEQKILYEEIARSNAPRLILYFVSLYHTASTLLEWGSEEQRNRFLPGILNGEIWCQGFSEPNAGSDLAAVKTRIERQDDHYVVTGQKIWSTMAQYADHCLLLGRSESTGVKQEGMTFLLVDMRSQGIEVRPITQITGDQEFAEIYFDGVEVPVANRLGAEGAGWAVAQATLASERGLTLLELSERMRGAMWRLLDATRQADKDNDVEILRAIGRLTARVEACSALADEFLTKRIEGTEQPGDASIVKLFYSRTLRDFTATGMRICGLDGQTELPLALGGGLETGNWMADFMGSYAWTIAGGSDEIQRNIIAERLLGMPREPREWKL